MRVREREGVAVGRAIVRWYLALFAWLTNVALAWKLHVRVPDAMMSEGRKAVESGRVRRILLSSNHPTRIDWALLYTVVDGASARGWLDAGDFRILMKSDLARVPGLGLAMWAVGCGYLVRRNREADTERLRTLVSPATVQNSSSLLLTIFPEGTDRSDSNVRRTRDFATTAGLPVPRHLLLPRHTGIATLAREAEPPLDEVWDATIVYEPRDPRVSEHSLLWGSPRPTRILIDFTTASVEPLRSERAKDWLQARWEAKDALMDDVYEGRGQAVDWDGTSPVALDSAGYRARLWLVAIVSAAYNVGVLYGLATSSMVRWVALVALVLQAHMLWKLR
jgi:1-acyl-sn-glycerol-3-phosphate acyltransferase